MWKNVIDLRVTASDITIKKRRKICNGCDKKKSLLGVAACSECNCPLKTKTLYVSYTCPLEKW